jgi:hypothetical protein
MCTNEKHVFPGTHSFYVILGRGKRERGRGKREGGGVEIIPVFCRKLL